ncbi:MAG: septal ring lytic transglycosylase RlpA family protein [Hyphomicrobiales bacterium]|nr:septal ring lytic transglycosylase RlpA family protein [Hyphomicrobiales bacterium]
MTPDRKEKESVLKDKKVHGVTACVTASLVFFSCLTPASTAEQKGVASIYSTDSGSKTASGQKLNPGALTAAHRTLPFGTKVRVTNKQNGRSVVVTINDRGPFIRGRIIDLTPAGGKALGFSGLAQVSVSQTAED